MENILCREATYTDGQGTLRKEDGYFRRKRGILDGVLKKGDVTDAFLRNILEDVHTFLKSDFFFAEHFAAGIVYRLDELHLVIAFVREEQSDHNHFKNNVARQWGGFEWHSCLKKGYKLVDLIQDEGDLNTINTFLSESGCYVRNVKPDTEYYP